MLTLKSKLSRFAATNRIITATCQAMKNTKRQEHQSDRDKKIATTTKRDKSEYLNYPSTFLPVKVKLTKSSNLENKVCPKACTRQSPCFNLL